jgi:hypothetical protein
VNYGIGGWNFHPGTNPGAAGQIQPFSRWGNRQGLPVAGLLLILSQLHDILQFQVSNYQKMASIVMIRSLRLIIMPAIPSDAAFKALAMFAAPSRNGFRKRIHENLKISCNRLLQRTGTFI